MQHKKWPLSCIAVTSILMISSHFAWTAEPEWTGWLGPQRNGWVDGFQPPQTWPNDLQQRWRVEVGSGYGSPLIANGRVYQHARQGEQEVTWCINLSNGKILWQQSDPTPFQMGGGGERHGKGPKSCPVMADDRLFTMSITGTLIARETETGRLIWKRDYNSRFPKSHPYWGVSASPIIVDNLIVVHFGNDDQGTLVALDTSTGNEVWTQGTDGTSYSSPLLAKFSGVSQIIDWNHNALCGIEVSSGALLWTQPFPHEGHNQNMPTPTINEGCILLGAENRGIHSFEPQLTDEGWRVKENWHQPRLALDMSTAVMNDGLLYGFSHYNSGQLFCLNPNTGEILWQSRGRSGQNVTFLSMPGHILALINDGELKIFSAAGKDTKQVASYRVADSPTWAPPVALSDGYLVKDQKSLTRWQFNEN
ncbi:MAG: serine/threonine protein kinase [Rhodopirellula sp. TMED283]|nr:MAG: serine/threonine protein kinase [Rhodopirellula sp. TMED283]